MPSTDIQASCLAEVLHHFSDASLLLNLAAKVHLQQPRLQHGGWPVLIVMCQCILIVYSQLMCELSFISHADIVPETITVGELRQLLQKQQQQKALAAANGASLLAAGP